MCETTASDIAQQAAHPCDPWEKGNQVRPTMNSFLAAGAFLECSAEVETREDHSSLSWRTRVQESKTASTLKVEYQKEGSYIEKEIQKFA